MLMVSAVKTCSTMMSGLQTALGFRSHRQMTNQEFHCCGHDLSPVTLCVFNNVNVLAYSICACVLSTRACVGLDSAFLTNLNISLERIVRPHIYIYVSLTCILFTLSPVHLKSLLRLGIFNFPEQTLRK